MILTASVAASSSVVSVRPAGTGVAGDRGAGVVGGEAGLEGVMGVVVGEVALVGKVPVHGRVTRPTMPVKSVTTPTMSITFSGLMSE